MLSWSHLRSLSIRSARRVPLGILHGIFLTSSLINSLLPCSKRCVGMYILCNELQRTPSLLSTRETTRISSLETSKKISKTVTIILKVPGLRELLPSTRQAEDIEASINRTYTSTIVSIQQRICWKFLTTFEKRTTSRRDAHSVIYQCAFYETFPSDSKAKEGNPYQENLGIVADLFFVKVLN